MTPKETPLKRAGRVLMKEKKDHLKQMGMFLIVFDEQLQRDIGASFRNSMSYQALSTLQKQLQKGYRINTLYKERMGKQ